MPYRATRPQTEERVCFIQGAGKTELVPAPREGDLVIAADGGAAQLAAAGVAPDAILGDFDSLGRVPRAECPVLVLPVEKDETDTAAAIAYGWERGYRRFCILGGTGGREDHTWANVAHLWSVAKRGGAATLEGDGFIRTVIVNNSLNIKPKKGATVSIFSLSEESRGVTLGGLYYPLRDAILRADTPLGVSNSALGEEATVSVKEGALLVMWEY